MADSVTAGQTGSWLCSFRRIQFAAPRQPVDVNTQRVFAQTLFGARSLLNNGTHCVPALGAGRPTVDEALLGPAHVEWSIAGPHYADNLHCDRLIADAGKRMPVAWDIVE